MVDLVGRDPIEETGGINLYGFCQNNPINEWDYLGMRDGKAFYYDHPGRHRNSSTSGRPTEQDLWIDLIAAGPGIAIAVPVLVWGAVTVGPYAGPVLGLAARGGLRWGSKAMTKAATAAVTGEVTTEAVLVITAAGGAIGFVGSYNDAVGDFGDFLIRNDAINNFGPIAEQATNLLSFGIMMGDLIGNLSNATFTSTTTGSSGITTDVNQFDFSSGMPNIDTGLQSNMSSPGPIQGQTSASTGLVRTQVTNMGMANRMSLENVVSITITNGRIIVETKGPPIYNGTESSGATATIDPGATLPAGGFWNWDEFQ